MSKRKGTQKKKAQKEPEEEELYAPEEILASQIDPKTLVAKFKVKWDGWDSSANTWEPLDHIYKYPMLLQAFTKKSKAALARPVKANVSKSSQDEATRSMPSFKKIPQTIIDKFHDPEEYIPSGGEKVSIFTREKVSDAGNFLWLTVFEGDPYPVLIRKCVANYYWPFQSCLFLTDQVHKNAKFKRIKQRLEKQKES